MTLEDTSLSSFSVSLPSSLLCQILEKATSCLQTGGTDRQNSVADSPVDSTASGSEEEEVEDEDFDSYDYDMEDPDVDVEVKEKKV